MKRESFVFYDSWMEAIEELPSVELRNEAMSAVVMYGLGKQTDEDWEQLNPFVRALLKIIKPMIDKNQKMYENAKNGGRKKVKDTVEEVSEEIEKPNRNQIDENENQIETKSKPNRNQIETKSEPNANQNEDLVSKSGNQANQNNVNVNVNVNDNVNVNSLSPSRACAEGSRLSGTERDRALLFLFFTKKIKHPEKELAKFEAYYAARGWKDPQGREIVDPIALLESWDIKNAKDTLTRQEVQLWEKLVNVLIKHNAFAPIVLSGFKSVEFRNDENLAIYGTKEMKRYLDQIFSEKVFNDLKRAFSAKGINYCQIN
jgi:hypothetical protein